MTSLLCVISFAVFFRAVERPSPRRWAVLALTNTLMLFTHYAAVFAVAAQGLALLWRWRGWANARRFAMSHARVAVVLVAWADDREDAISRRACFRPEDGLTPALLPRTPHQSYREEHARVAFTRTPKEGP